MRIAFSVGQLGYSTRHKVFFLYDGGRTLEERLYGFLDTPSVSVRFLSSLGARTVMIIRHVESDSLAKYRIRFNP